jgi:hypothetical protein
MLRLSKEGRNISTLNVFKSEIRKVDVSFLEDGGCRNCYLCSN